MWLLSNNTPFAAERTWVRDQNGAEVWIVAVKGSFVIRPDSQQVLDSEQKEISRVPEFTGDPGCSSLICESDLVHTKSRMDVLLYGHAYCRGGRPATKVDIRLKVANVDKTLRVFGDRKIKRSAFGVSLTRPKPFTQMPILYERAFGGTDLRDENPKRHRWEPRNPVGVGFGVRKKHIVGTPAPNIEVPGSPYRDWRKGEPAGFGAIARHWLPRVAYAGTYDDVWEKTKNPLLPSDFDERFYQCAPEDQQVDGFLNGGEVVELYNMTPEGYLSFPLPKVTLGMTTRFYDGTPIAHNADLHTLIVRPDQRSFQLVWHSKLPCHHKEDKLQETDIILKRRVAVPQTEIETGMWIGE